MKATISAIAAAAIRTAAEYDEAMAACKAQADMWGMEAERLIKEAKIVAASTTMSMCEALGYVTEQERRRAANDGPHPPAR